MNVSICILFWVHNASSGINQMEFKLILCPFHNLVFLSTVNIIGSYGLISVGTNWAMWQTAGDKVCV